MIRADTLRLSLFACAFALAAPVAAQDDELQPIADPRLVTQVFDETQVYTVKGRVKVQTTIKFAPDEVIQNVAIGDSGAWQVQPNQAQTLLFVKPLATNAQTNMTVVTSRRTYLFDLDASPRNAPLYVLQFRYPALERAAEEAEIAAAAQAEREAASALELEAANDPFAVVDPARLNFEWAPAGESDLFPARAYDDGEALFLTWPAGTPIPAILVTNEEGDEGPVNFTVRGETVVVDNVPTQIILRSGKERATLTNLGPTSSRSASANGERARGS
ncbi:TrbG/VirB9 family P-type conjugative transfer protein [uncultured Erythrobacter sp.]|uniref:TrbG/VirB9 family P-type conjugative transfer protein n=1 Tax=uncultured Erythrobacter sp. TaxID=263913 RepID=UPI00262EB67F|nr:TrbG/VirB9 family P-type conjugative transfer protein [uncultured Erythrobacter sp.]